MYLVTGAAGFIGFHLSLAILKKGHSVVGLDNVNDYYNKKIKYDRLKILKKFSKFHFLKVDLSNKKALHNKINKYKKKVSIIIHLAGQAGVRYSIINPMTYIKNNIMSYINLLDFFKNKKNIKLIIYASSSSIYGDLSSKKTISSEPQVNPISVYSASKLSMELISKVYHHIYTMSFIGIRFFSVYGPWGRPDMFYLKFLNSLKNNKKIKIYNHGKHYRSFTYIDDVISNLFKVINKFSNSKKKICDVFNIGNPNSIYLKKFIDILEKKMGKKAKKLYISKQLGDLVTTKSNIIREKKIFNHQTKTTLSKGSEKLIKWFNSYY